MCENIKTLDRKDAALVFRPKVAKIYYVCLMSNVQANIGIRRRVDMGKIVKVNMFATK